MSRSKKQIIPELKFLLDENVDARLAFFLIKKGLDVATCRKGLQNGTVISLAKKQSRILLTNDKDFANTDIYKPSDCSGIIVFKIHPPKLNKIIAAFEKLLSTFSSNDFAGRLFMVSDDGVEIVNE